MKILKLTESLSLNFENIYISYFIEYLFWYDETKIICKTWFLLIWMYIYYVHNVMNILKSLRFIQHRRIEFLSYSMPLEKYFNEIFAIVSYYLIQRIA